MSLSIGESFKKRIKFKKIFCTVMQTLDKITLMYYHKNVNVHRILYSMNIFVYETPAVETTRLRASRFILL